MAKKSLKPLKKISYECDVCKVMVVKHSRRDRPFDARDVCADSFCKKLYPLTAQEREREILKYVTCNICNQKGIYQFSNHLKKKHSITVEQYQNSFPGAIVTTEYIQTTIKDSCSKGGIAFYNKMMQDPEKYKEFRKSVVKNIDWQARNEKKKKTDTERGSAAKTGARMKLLFQNPEFAARHKQLRAQSEEKRAASWAKTIDSKYGKEEFARLTSERSKALAAKRSPEAWARIADGVQRSSKKGSKIERKFLLALQKSMPQYQWKTHVQVQTNDPYGKNGRRQFDIFCADLNLYLDWNGFPHYEPKWRNPNEDEIQEAKRAAVLALGSKYFVVKDYKNNMTAEKAVLGVKEFLLGTDSYQLFDTNSTR